MILIDSRIGSKELLPLFPKGTAKLSTLPYGDFAFTGNGPEGMPINIGIERKQIREIASTIVDGRLVGHQVPGLLKEYGVTYLVVEGRWRGNPKTGILEQTRGGPWVEVVNGTKRWMAGDIRKFLSTLENIAGIRLRLTEDKAETVAEVLTLHAWWTGKEWEEHRAHIAMQYPPVDTLMFTKPSVFRQVAACLPGIGIKKSRAVEDHFWKVGVEMGAALLDMILADKKDWCKVEGIDKGIAKRIIELLDLKRR